MFGSSILCQNGVSDKGLVIPDVSKRQYVKQGGDVSHRNNLTVFSRHNGRDLAFHYRRLTNDQL